MTWADILNEIKSQEPNVSWLLGLKRELIREGVNAWEMCDPIIERNLLEVVSEDLSYSERINILWKSVTFNKAKFKNLISKDIPKFFLLDLIKSGLIYPDGTKNESFFSLLMMPPPDKKEK